MRMMGKSGHARDGKFVGERYYVLSNASRTTAIAGGSRLASATIFVLSLLTSGNDCGRAPVVERDGGPHSNRTVVSAWVAHVPRWCSWTFPSLRSCGCGSHSSHFPACSKTF